MTIHRVNLDQFTRILVALSPKIEAAVIRGLRSGALRLQGMVVEEIDAASPYPAVDRGELRGSVEYATESDGAVVYVDAPHAAHLEYGTRPFWPPLAPIKRWVLRKGFAEDEEEAEGIARAVQRKIAEEGIEPRGYMAKAFQRVVPVVIQEVEKQLDGI